MSTCEAPLRHEEDRRRRDPGGRSRLTFLWRLIDELVPACPPFDPMPSAQPPAIGPAAHRAGVERVGGAPELEAGDEDPRHILIEEAVAEILPGRAAIACPEHADVV